MLEPLKIVIVEDDLALNDLIAKRLQKEGHSCVGVHSVEESIQWLSSDNTADLMLLDLGLPDRGGEELVSEMQMRNIEIPFIVVTGQGSEAIAVKMLKKGARDYLVKNIEIYNVLPATIEMVWKEVKLERLLEKAEQRIRFQNATLSAVQNLSPDAIMVNDSRGKIISHNQTLLEIFGKSDSLEGENVKSVLLDFAVKLGKETEIKEILGKVNVANETLQIEDISYNNKIFNIYSVPMTVESENIINVLGRVWYFRDVTTFKEAEKAMAKAKYEVEAHSQMKDSFFSMITHDIKTPLNAVSGFAELLELTELGDTQKDYIGHISDSANYLTYLVDDILELTRIEHGGFELTIEKFNLPEILDMCIEGFDHKVTEKGISLVKIFSKNIPEYIVGDKQRVRRVITNLLSNAIKFTSKGTVTLSCKSKNDKFLELKVIDTGIGIKKEYQDMIYTPFSQEDFSISRKYGGTGLGLSIVKYFVEAFGGSISLESEPGKGATFIVILPKVFNANMTK